MTSNRLLTCCPVIIPPRPGLIDSWTHRPHLVVINGAHDTWRPLVAEHGWLTHEATDRRNLTCPVAWNHAFHVADKAGCTHVALLSQSFVFLDPMTEWVDLIERHAPHDRAIIQQHTPFHCIVIPTAMWHHVGRFDESLPIWSDVDFLRRAQLAGHPDPYLVPVNALDERCAALTAGAVTAELYHDDKVRFIAKWSRHPPASPGTKPA